MQNPENPENPETPIKKKRGRKPKLNSQKKNNVELGPDGQPIKKKRGRKKKVVTEVPKDGGERKRKRGRKPRCDIASIQEIRERFNNSNDKVVFSGPTEFIETDLDETQVPFGNMNITVHTSKPTDKTELRNMFSKQKEESQLLKKNKNEQKNDYYTTDILDNHENVTDISESESDVPGTINSLPICSKCRQRENNLETKDNEILVKKEKKKIHTLMYKFTSKIEETKEWPSKCSILCWWCCHSFGSTPIPSVTKYDYKRKRFALQGIFCSWNCAASYTMESTSRNIFHLYKLRKEWTGQTSNIEKAPHKTILKAFGGYMGIEEFRKSPHEDRKLIMPTPQFSYENQQIAEIYNEIRKNKNRKKYQIRKKINCQ